MTQMTQGYILKKLHKGAVILVEHINHPPSSRRTVYRLSTTNEVVRGPTVTALLKDGLIQPNEDGLPGMGITQSYRLWRASEGGA